MTNCLITRTRSGDRKTRITLVMLALLAAPAVAAEPPSAPAGRAYSAFHDDPSRHFDFWIGRWQVDLRSQQPDLDWAPLASAIAHIYPILDGKAILELWDSEAIKGFSLRYYDPAREEWVLWLNWPNPAVGRIALRGLTGQFRHGRAVFEGEHGEPDGTKVISRFTFSDVTPFSLRWHDDYSRDGGKTWQPNWIMEFTREAVETEWPIRRGRAPTIGSGSRCEQAPFERLEALDGHWVAVSGEHERELRLWPILNGCAVIGLLEGDDGERFLYFSYNSFRMSHELAVLDDRPGTGLERYFGDGFADLEGEEGAWRWQVTDDGVKVVLEDGEGSRTLLFRPIDGDQPTPAK